MMLESHITVSTEHALAAAEVAEAMHWKTSEIARDPVLGNKNYFYLTSHDTDWARMFERMHACTRVLKAHGIPVLREKIELIVYDTKSST
jgi:hypothetical protein